MNIEMNCPTCPGRLSFAARRNGGHGRLVGSCRSCGSVFSLYGGRVTPIDAALPRPPAGPAWNFGSLVARERRAALRVATGGAAAAD